jgi:hypothetical protein
MCTVYRGSLCAFTSAVGFHNVFLSCSSKTTSKLCEDIQTVYIAKHSGNYQQAGLITFQVESIVNQVKTICEVDVGRMKF